MFRLVQGFTLSVVYMFSACKAFQLDNVMTKPMAWGILTLPITGEGGNSSLALSNYAESDYRTSLSGDGGTMVIGLPSHDNARGAVWTYQRIGSALGEEDAWVADDDFLIGDFPDSQMGYAVGLNHDGTVLVVGSPHVRWDRENRFFPSRARVYSRRMGRSPTTTAESNRSSWVPSNTGWEQMGANLLEAPELNVNDPDFVWYEATSSGSAVAVSDDGQIVAIGASNWFLPDTSENARNGTTRARGLVKVFQWNTSSDDWDECGEPLTFPDIPGVPRSYQRFGFSLDMNGAGDRLVVGSPQYVRGASDDWKSPGVAQVYEKDATPDGITWNMLGVPIYGDDPIDMAGYSVSMSQDGNRFAVGIPGAAIVRVYHWAIDDENGGNGTRYQWRQVGNDIGPFGNDETGGADGRSVALSGDGSTVAVYSPYWTLNCVTNNLVGVFRQDVTNTATVESKSSVSLDFLADWSLVADRLPGEGGNGPADFRGTPIALDYGGDMLVVAASYHWACDDSWLDFSCGIPCSRPDWTANIRVAYLENHTGTFMPSSSPSSRPSLDSRSEAPTGSLGLEGTESPGFSRSAASNAFALFLPMWRFCFITIIIGSFRCK